MTEHERRVDALRRHNHRLATQLAEAEARAERLRQYGLLWEDDFREQMQGQHDEFVEATITAMRDEALQPTDLDAAPGDPTEREVQR